MLLFYHFPQINERLFVKNASRPSDIVSTVSRQKFTAQLQKVSKRKLTGYWQNIKI